MLKCFFIMNKMFYRFLFLVVVMVAVCAHGQNGLVMISIETSGALSAEKKVAGRMRMDGYDGGIGIKLRGNSSLGFAQKKYTIELRSDDGGKLAAGLLGMPAHSDWVLLAPYNDVSAVRDALAFQLWRDMGHWAPHTRLVELMLDGEYRGIYILSEAIKRGRDRVDIAKMGEGDRSGREVTGGYLLRIDTFNDDDATFTSKVPGIGEGCLSSEVVWSCIYPKKKDLQPEQFAYIQSYVDTVELVVQSDYFADADRGYARYIDVGSFVDYFIHTELSLNADGYRRSAYFYKDRQDTDGRGGKLVAGPVWDYNLAYGNANFAHADDIEAWCFEGASNSPTPALWQRLLQDRAFRRAVKIRYAALRGNVLSNERIFSYIDRHAAVLKPCIGRHFERYPELLVREGEKRERAKVRPFGGFPPMGWFPMTGDSIPHFPDGFPMMGGFPMTGDSIPHFPGGFPVMGGFPMMGGFGGVGDMVGMFAAYRVSSYDEEISILKQWLADRLSFLDRTIERFDKDWEPRVQPLVEKKMQFPFWRE